MEDVLWFFNACAWVFEPRALSKVLPFCTWNHQDPAIVQMDQAISDSEGAELPIDVVVNKSRGQGATWMYLIILLRRWLRDPMFSAGLVTRNEKLVDSLRDPDTLLWKVAWELDRLPSWLLPAGFDLSKHRSISDHAILNPENGASIVGYSATGDVARGGRKTCFAMDELAAFRDGEDYKALDSTAHVTNCRFLVSTFLGDSGAYYDSAMQDGNAIKIILDWKENPTQNQKLYRMVNGQMFEVDPRPDNRIGPKDKEKIKAQHTQLIKRGFKLEGKIRNEWYNNQCLRPGATPRGIAQELDRDPHGSVAKVFEGLVLKRMREQHAKPPVIQGRMNFNKEQTEVVPPFVTESEAGELRLWTLPGLNGRIKDSLYVIGADVASGRAGSYTSNSVACVVDKMTGEQVAEWVSNKTPPIDFAYVLATLGKWFHNAHLVVEANFSGSCLDTLVDVIGYQNLYYRKVDIIGQNRKTDKPGFWMTSDDARLRLFENFQAAMATGSFTPRSKELLEECPQYEWKNGKIVHIGSTKTDDESGKGKAHGDRVIAAALAWLVCEEEPVLDVKEDTPIITPPGSYAERLQEHRALVGVAGDPWENPALDIFSQNETLRDEWD
jgi:hypothetical protein